MADNRGPQLIAVIGFFLAFSWTFVLLRCYCKAIVVKSFGLDDGLCFVAQILFTIFCGFTVAAVANGVGQHIEDVPPSDIPLALKWVWISDPFYVFSNMLLKFSIGMFLLRICVSKIQRGIIWCVMVVSGITCIYFTCIALFQCWPVTYFWEQAYGEEGSCMNTRVLIASTYAYTAMSCWSDWTYCIVPVFVIWNLQMNRRTKIGVCLILGVSSIASLVTLIRIPSIAELGNVQDFLYATTNLTLWSICETGLALAACAATTLRPLFHLVGAAFTSHDTGTSAMHQSPHRDAWPSRAGYARSGCRTGTDDMGVKTDIGRHIGRDRDAIHLSGWPEDDQSSNAEVDRASNSSQTKLKTDLETGLPLANLSSGIKKTVVVTSQSVRVSSLAL